MLMIFIEYHRCIHCTHIHTHRALHTHCRVGDVHLICSTEWYRWNICHFSALLLFLKPIHWVALSISGATAKKPLLPCMQWCTVFVFPSAFVLVSAQLIFNLCYRLVVVLSLAVIHKLSHRCMCEERLCPCSLGLGCIEVIPHITRKHFQFKLRCMDVYFAVIL